MIKAIVAHNEEHIIGNNGQIPWHLKGDFANFKKTTSGHTVVMGRKTFDSIGKPLPNRRNVVLTRDKNWKRDGVEVVHTIEDVLAFTEDVFILGGEEVYRLFIPHVKKYYVTEVYGDFAGDAKFPNYHELPYLKEIYASEIMQEGEVSFRFKEYEVV